MARFTWSLGVSQPSLLLSTEDRKAVCEVAEPQEPSLALSITGWRAQTEANWAKKEPREGRRDAGAGKMAKERMGCVDLLLLTELSLGSGVPRVRPGRR